MGPNLVAYDLHDADAYDYEILINELESLGSAHLQESVWSVNFDGSPIDLAKNLAPYLMKKDRLQILSYGGEGHFSHNTIDGHNRFKEIVTTNDFDTTHFQWGTKLTRK